MLIYVSMSLTCGKTETYLGPYQTSMMENHGFQPLLFLLKNSIMDPKDTFQRKTPYKKNIKENRTKAFIQKLL